MRLFSMIGVAGKASGRRSEARRTVTPRSGLEKWFCRRMFTLSFRIRMYKRLSTLLKNRTPILDALEVIWKKESQGGKKPKNPTAMVIADMMRSMRAGKSFHAAIQEWASDGEVMIFSAAEASGNLEGRLVDVIATMTGVREIKNAIIREMSYPAMLIVVALVAFYSMSIKMLPIFSKLMPPDKATGVAALYYQMATILLDHAPVMFVSSISFISVLIWSLPNWTGGWRSKFDGLPVFSIYRMHQGAIFFLTLSALFKGNVTIVDALTKMRRIASPYLSERLEKTRVNMKSGHNLGESLAMTGYNFPSKDAIGDLEIYSKYSGLTEQIDIMAKEWKDEGGERIKSEISVVKVLLMFVAAFLIGVMLTGMISISQQSAAYVSQSQVK